MFGWRFQYDPPWGLYVDSIADGRAPAIPLVQFPNVLDLQDFADRYAPTRSWPPVLAPLKSTCASVNMAIAANFGEPLLVSQAVVYAGEDLLISSMMEIPIGVDRTLPLYQGATYSVVEGTRVKHANPLVSAQGDWTTLTKHELVIVNGVDGNVGVRATVISDE